MIDYPTRVGLAHLPTPLEEMPRFSAALGGPRLLIKRDDQTGLATGGNKARKLEFLIADALALARKIEQDPKTAELAKQREQAKRKAEAGKAYAQAEAHEKAARWEAALRAYGRVRHEYGDTPFKEKAAAATARLEKDPQVVAVLNRGKARKLFRRAENYLRNNMRRQAREMYRKIAEAFPGTEIEKEAKEKAAQLR